jgi:phage-related protein
MIAGIKIPATDLDIPAANIPITIGQILFFLYPTKSRVVLIKNIDSEKGKNIKTKEGTEEKKIIFLKFISNTAANHENDNMYTRPLKMLIDIGENFRSFHSVGKSGKNAALSPLYPAFIRL